MPDRPLHFLQKRFVPMVSVPDVLWAPCSSLTIARDRPYPAVTPKTLSTPSSSLTASKLLSLLRPSNIHNPIESLQRIQTEEAASYDTCTNSALTYGSEPEDAVRTVRDSPTSPSWSLVARATLDLCNLFGSFPDVSEQSLCALLPTVPRSHVFSTAFY